MGSRKPCVFLLRQKTEKNWTLVEHNPDMRAPNKGIIPIEANLDALSGDIYNWTQCGILEYQEVEVPIGSTIVVEKLDGTTAVVVLFGAWPVLVTGELPSKDALHRFRTEEEILAEPAA